MSSHNVRSYKTIAIVFALAAFLAWAGSQNGKFINGYPVFFLCVFIAFAIQWIAFFPAYLLQTERFYDLVGSITYLSVIAIAVFLTQAFDIRSMLLAGMVSIWALRLGIFLFTRILKDGSDNRFDQIKPNPIRFFSVWNLQALWVSITAACALVAITADVNKVSLDSVGLIGVGIWFFGFAIEAIADYQKRIFRAANHDKKKFIDTGLWAFSRHPNYFGEIIIWVGVSLVALPVLTGWQHVALISPVFVFILLTRVSGIPLLEAKADKAWGGTPAYEYYKANTPVLLPRFTRPAMFKDH